MAPLLTYSAATGDVSPVFAHRALLLAWPLLPVLLLLWMETLPAAADGAASSHSLHLGRLPIVLTMPCGLRMLDSCLKPTDLTSSMQIQGRLWVRTQHHSNTIFLLNVNEQFEHRYVNVRFKPRESTKFDWKGI